MNLPLLVMTAVVLLEAFSDVLVKQWSLKYNPFFLAAALLGYIVTNVFWLYALKNGIGLTRGTIIFSVGLAVLWVLISVLFYKEVLTPLQSLGVVLGLVGAVMIFWE